MKKEELKQQIREEIQVFETHEELLDYLDMSEEEYKEIMEDDID